MPFTIPNYGDASYGDQAEPDSIDFNILASSIAGNGVISGCAVTAQGTPDMSVAVSAGTVSIGGTVVAVSAGTVTITTANATDPRFDLIRVNSGGTLSALAGTASSNPVFPTPASTDVVLASVYVPANDTTIGSTQIVDKRIIVEWNTTSGFGTYQDITATSNSPIAISLNDNTTSLRLFADYVGGVYTGVNIGGLTANGSQPAHGRTILVTVISSADAAQHKIKFNDTTLNYKIAYPNNNWPSELLLYPDSDMFSNAGFAIMLVFDSAIQSWRVLNDTGPFAYASLGLNQFAATTSSQLASVISDETGTGAVVFATGGTLTTPTIGTAGFNVAGSTSGSTRITTSATASGTVVIPGGAGTVATLAGTQTLTNKTINFGSNTITGTLAQFNTALSDQDFASLAGTETLSNKTLTTPNIGVATGTSLSVSGALTSTAGTISALALGGSLLASATPAALTSTGTAGAATIPARSDHAHPTTGLSTSSGTETLTNKTINLGSNTVTGTLAQFNTALSDQDFASLAGTETLSNKTLTSPNLGTPSAINLTNATALPNSATSGTSTATANTLVLRDANANFAAGTVTGTLSGNATTATALSSSRSFALTGDVTGTQSSDLTSGVSIASTLGTTGVTVGTYSKVTVDTKGRVTTGAIASISDLSAPTAAVSFGTQRITNLATPTTTTDAVTKAYVDAVATGLDIKASVRVATTAAITLSGTQTIDGVAVVTGDRVLVKNQGGTASNLANGIYVVAASTWTRATDFDSVSDPTAGSFMFVTEGTTNGETGWVLVTNDPITIDSTALQFSQFATSPLLSSTSPSDIASSASVGTLTTAARADHIHSTGANITVTGTVSAAALGGAVLSSTTPGTLSATGTAGVATTVSRSDHTHPNTNLLTTATTSTGAGSLVYNQSPALVTPNIGAATGTSLSVSGNLTSTAGTVSALALGGSLLASAVPAALTASGTAGAATVPARSDHAHPTTGLSTSSGTETLTNKTINLGSNTITGTLAQFNTALSDAEFASLAGTETFTNKTVNLGSNTITGTLAQFNTALSDQDFASLAGTETLSNKTFVAPVLGAATGTSLSVSGNLTSTAGSISALGLAGSLLATSAPAALSSGGTYGASAIPARSDHAHPTTGISTSSGTEALTNKTINLGSNTITGTLAQFNTALSDAEFASTAGAETLSNKTINLGSNTITGTLAQFNSALSDAEFASLAGTETLSNKTLTAPNIGAATGTSLSVSGALTSTAGTVSGSTLSSTGNITAVGTVSAAALGSSLLSTTTPAALTSGGTYGAAVFPARSDHSHPTTGLSTSSGTEALTNKTINLGSNTLTGTLAQFNTALSDAEFASLAGTETLTNKTVNLTSNTITGTLAQFNTALSDQDFASLAGTETLSNKTFVAPVLGTATGTSLSVSGNLTSTAGTISALALGGSLLASSTPAVLTAAGTSGVATVPARSDHAHPTTGLIGTTTTATGTEISGTFPLLILGTTGVTAGTYTRTTLTVDSKGRLSAASSTDNGWKDDVRAATTGTVALTGTQTIDGIALIAGDRVLVKDQATAANNGIYVVSATAWSRSTDADTAAEVSASAVNVLSGTTNGGNIYKTTFKSTDTLGSTSMTWYEIVDTGGAAFVGTITSTSTISAATLSSTGNITAVGTISAAALGSTLLSTTAPAALSSGGTYGTAAFPARADHAHPTTGISTTSGTEALTNKTINLGSNTITGTLAQFNTALSDQDFASLAGTETLSNKTFVAPVLGTATGTSLSVSGNLTSTAGSVSAGTISGALLNSTGNVTATGTVSAAALGGAVLSSTTPAALTTTGTAGVAVTVSRSDHTHPTTGFATTAGTETFTNKTFGTAGFGIAGSTSGTATVTTAAASTGVIVLPGFAGTIATLFGTETLTNKTFVGPTLGTATGTSLSVTGALTSTAGTISALSLGGSLLVTSAPAALSSVGTYGVATLPARSDHAHPTSATKLSIFGTTSSSELASIITDETGTGPLVFGTSPVIVTPLLTLGTVASTVDGRIYWDTSTDEIKVGNSVTAATFVSSFNSWKPAVRVATTGTVSLSGTLSIDGILVAVGDRVLVKDQTATANNGIYVVSATTWSRATESNSAQDVAASVVAVDSGTTNGGTIWYNSFKSTDTLGTTSMSWSKITSGASGYTSTIGDGTTSTFTVTHSLGTRDVIVTCYSLSSPYETLLPVVTRPDTSSVSLSFMTPPASNSVRVMVRT